MTPATRARWAEAFTASARAHWTAARTRELTAGKDLLILPAEAPLLLRALGLLHRDATMPPAQVRKFLQINHMVGVLEPSLRELMARHPVVRLVDAGCGRSYLSMLLAWCAKHAWRHRIEVLGVDRQPALIEVCRERAAIGELDDVMRFVAAPLDEVALDGVHGVVALHACDTATCDALALAVAANAELIAVAPCCQAELARGWTGLEQRGEVGPFAPLWGAPHLRRETAAHLTDAMRMLLLRAAGYQVTAMEFIAAEHTQKNTLLRARRAEVDPSAWAAYQALVAATGGVGLGLAERIVGPR